MTDTQAKLLREICQAFVEAVKAGGDLGVPGGTLYAASMDKMSLAQFEQVMSALVAMRKVRKSGHLYFFLADV